MNWPRARWSLSEGGAIQRLQSIGGKEGVAVCARKRLRRAPAPHRLSQVMAAGPTEDERGGKELSSPSQPLLCSPLLLLLGRLRLFTRARQDGF